MFANETAAFFLLARYSDENFDQTGDLSAEDALLHAQTFIDSILDLFGRINSDMGEVELQTHFYDVGKEYYGGPQNLRAFFRDCYLMLTGRPEGSRIGVMVYILGVDEFKSRMCRRMNDPLGEFK